MSLRDKRKGPAPSDVKLGAHSSKTPLEILTVNVRGMNSYVDVMEQRKDKYKSDMIEKKESKKTKNKKIDDTDLLLFWITENSNKIIVLTETKLHEVKKELIFRECVKVLSEDAFWVFCNHNNKASAGVITLIPKKIFHKPKHCVLEKGMVTHSEIRFKSRERLDFVLISYYNPNSNKNSQLSKIILEQKAAHEEKVIIVGDFNQMLDSEIDYENAEKDKLSPMTIEKKGKKSQKFKKLVSDCNLFYTRGEDNLFTYRKDSNTINYKSRIDWIFYSAFFNHKENAISSEIAPFCTDHSVVKQTLFIPEKIVKEKNNGRAFVISEKYFEDPSFLSALRENLKKENSRKISCTPNEKLVNMIDTALRTAKDHKRRKDKEKNKKKKYLRKKLKEKQRKKEKEEYNSSEEEENEQKIREEAEEYLWKDLYQENAKKRVIFEKIKGANKIYSRYHKKKTRIKSKVEYLENDKGEKLYGRDAIKHAHEVFTKIVSNEESQEKYISKLSHGPKFDEETKNILNKKFTEIEIRNAINNTPNREPGPSGMRITLFKKMIDHFSPILTNIANEALSSGICGEFLMQGTITLIPKKENSNNVNDLRPITLLEIPRKIITKAMTTRLKQVLLNKNIISEYQFCHPGRLIHDNVHTLNLLIERAKKRKERLSCHFP